MSLMLHEMLIGRQFEVVAVASTTSTSSTISYPADVRAGDMLILIDRSVNSASVIPTAVTPAGFTAASKSDTYTISTFGVRFHYSYRIATAPLSGSVTGMSSTSSTYKMMILLRPIYTPISSVTPSDFGFSQATTTVNHVAPTSGLTGDNFSLFVYSCGNFQTLPVTSLSPAQPGAVTQSALVARFGVLPNPMTSNTTMTGTTSSGNVYCGSLNFALQ